MSSLKDLKKICGHRRVEFSPNKNDYRNWNVPIKKSISGIESFYQWNQCSKMGDVSIIFPFFDFCYWFPLDFITPCNKSVSENIISFSTNHGLLTCTWSIDRNYSFALVFTRFNLKYDQKCEYSYLQVNGREKLCGSEIPNPVFMDLGVNSTQLTFFSTGSGAKQNFELRILEINDESGKLIKVSPNFRSLNRRLKSHDGIPL